MYSHYQYYQQQPGGAAVEAQQQAASFGGPAWATTVAPVAPSSYSTYQQPYSQAAAYVSDNSSSVSTEDSQVPLNLVQRYTQYYHQWHSRAQEQERYLASLPFNAPNRSEAQRHVEWSKYYADQSSKAAHHFHNNPGIPAPFELPPAPESISSIQQPQPVVSSVQQQPHAQPEESPDGLKRYVHKCLSRCSTEEERKAVQKEIEKKIARAIQSNTLHTTNWDGEEVIVLGSGASGQPQQQAPQNHYGVQVSSSRSHNSSNKRYYDNLPANDSYYGRSFSADSSSAAPTASRPIESSSQGKTKNQKRQRTNNDLNGDFIAVPNDRKKKVLKSKHKFDVSSSTMAKRAKRFSGPAGIADAAAANLPVGGYERYMGKGVIGGSDKKLLDSDYEMMTVKGTCHKLEKEYLRLTAPPKAELVRPRAILELHMVNLKAEFGRSQKRDYLWFCSQLKAVRQDCTVQRIQDEFTVDVYETHARIALQEGDLNEYNQCQTQLKYLYEKLVGNEEALKNRSEFLAYRLIYYLFLMGNEKYDGGSSDLFKIMLSLTPAERLHPCIDHALKVRAAIADSDYHTFFHLFDSCPNIGSYLMKLIVPSMRFKALRRICKAYRPKVDTDFVVNELGLGAASKQYIRKWLESCGCVLSADGSELITKDCVVRESELDEKSSLI